MRNVRYPEDSDNPILVPETPEFEDEESIDPLGDLICDEHNLDISASAIDACAMLPSQIAASLPPASPEEARAAASY